jgi:hypothetical protein
MQQIILKLNHIHLHFLSLTCIADSRWAVLFIALVVAVGVGVAEPRPRDARPVGALPFVVAHAAAARTARRRVPVVVVVVVVVPVERRDTIK